MKSSFQTMHTLLYLHGFQSSSQSQKAVSLQRYFNSSTLKSNYRLIVPDLPFSPLQTIEMLELLIKQHNNVVLMGSSMGGFYASYFSQKHDLPAVLINPVVHANALFDSFLGKVLENVYTAETYKIEKKDLLCLKKMIHDGLSRPDLLFNCLETGDEVLDYRIAQTYYKDCQQKIIQGGDHRFQSFEEYLPIMLQFYESF